MSKILENKIKNKKAVIAVVGLGYVGLPLAVNFARKGFKVFGLDKDTDRVRKIRNKENYILDIPDADIRRVVGNRRLEVYDEFGALKLADVIIVCVPTPIKTRYTPDVSFVLSAVRTIAGNFKNNTLIVLESTTYPGTTEELILPELEKGGRKLDKNFYLSFSPERIDPGNKRYDVTKIAKLVGGCTKRSGELTRTLYEKIIKDVHLVSSSKVAEMSKLLENSFRIINIGWINEVAMMCHKLGINVWEVIEAAKTKPFGFMPFYPGLGVGGHCIPEDPIYLYWKAKLHGFNSKYIKLSADTNAHMPAYVIDRLRGILQDKHKSLSGAKILVAGVTYKKDVKDLRKSPPLKLIELLGQQKAQVDYFDPIIPYLDIGGVKLRSLDLSKNILRQFDAVIIATDHTAVDYRFILTYAKMIFDTRNVYKGIDNKKIIRL
ncbi:MAG: nucleotide sugar dehydrogenase [Candidatus Omnitrophota bacterium]